MILKRVRHLKMKAGEVTKIHVVMGQTGVIETSASEKENGKWVATYHDIYVNEDGKAGEACNSAIRIRKRTWKQTDSGWKVYFKVKV